jgi:hypothetical protein
MKTIIALRGKHNSGKSETIRILYSLLLQNGYQQGKTNYRVGCKDFYSFFTKNRKIICITSSGDTYDIVHNQLKKFVDKGCYICVCACRLYDRNPKGTIAAILEFNKYSLLFIPKLVSNNKHTWTVTNRKDARSLLALVENFM